MNKLEEYRNKFAHSQWDEGNIYPEYNMSASDMNDCIKQGFDAAIALDLPVKFAEWKDENFHQNSDKDYYPSISSIHFDILKLVKFNKQDSINLKELYKYWIDNIYKPE